VKSAHDCSDGGLAVALAECCISDRENILGATASFDENMRADCLLFGETQSRIILSTNKADGEKLVELCSENGVPINAIGIVGGESLIINNLIDLSVSKMAEAYFQSLGKILAKA
jgi:phosphoribosylformylglycinamidine synthase